jgi:protein-disulfide isomerase
VRCATLVLLSLLLVGCTAHSAPVLEGASASSQTASSVSSPPALDVQSAIQSGTTLNIGKADAPLKLLVFTNQSCTYCRDFWQTIVPQLKQDYVDTGTLQLEIAILPIRKYPWSALDASSLFCAGKQGKGPEMHAALFSEGAHTEATTVQKLAALKLNKPAFVSCLHSTEASAYADAQNTLAEKLSVTLVPTLFLGDEKNIGLMKYPDLKGWIESKMK